MLEFKEYKLKDISTFEYGRMPDKLKLKNAGYPVYSGYRIVGFYAEYMFQRAKLLIIARGVGGTGNVRISPPFSYITNLSIIFNENEDLVDYRYLYYYLGNKNMRILDTGSCQSQITINQLEDYKVQLPSKAEQIKILGVLATIDSKIEINNQINAELEKMAKTLYDYWFVQFDFPDENGKPYRSSGGKMVWNAELKREIPDGWESHKINSIIEVKDGTHDSPKPQNEGYRLITSKNLQVSGLDFENANLISEEDYFSIIKRSNVETGDILFSMIGNIGTIYKVEEPEINFAIKNVALYKTSQNKEYKNYVYMFLKSIDMDRYMKNVISGSIQKFIGLNNLRDTPFLFNEALIKKYNELTFSIFEKLENIKIENQKLTELRDWLLPMLINGQVKILS